MQGVKGKKPGTRSATHGAKPKADKAAARAALEVIATAKQTKQNEDKASGPGVLAQRIHIRRVEIGQGLAELAAELQLSYSYLVSVLSSEDRIRAISRELIVRISKYLNVSVAQVYVWAGVVTAEDFYVADELASALDRAFHAMQEDPAGLFCPTYNEWKKLPIDTRTFITRLYERATGVHFLAPMRVPSSKK